MCYISNQAVRDEVALLILFNTTGCGLIKKVMKCRKWRGSFSAVVMVCVKEIVNNSSFKWCPVEFEQSLNIPLFHLTSICAGVVDTKPFKLDVVSGTSAYSKCQDLSEPQ